MMQSNIIKLMDSLRSSDMKEVQSFRIKVHSAGELPWMSQNPSSWEKIDADLADMSTVALSVKGEKVDNTVGFTLKWSSYS